MVSNKPGAYALERAKKAGVPAAVVSKQECGSQAAFEQRLQGILELDGVDMIILAGFMSILSQTFTAKWPNRILNVHPSLIPAFCGAGYYGLRVHEAALARGVKVTGATVHMVNEIPDGGPIVLQKAVEVLPGDTPETPATPGDGAGGVDPSAPGGGSWLPSSLRRDDTPEFT